MFDFEVFITKLDFIIKAIVSKLDFFIVDIFFKLLYMVKILSVNDHQFLESKRNFFYSF